MINTPLQPIRRTLAAALTGAAMLAAPMQASAQSPSDALSEIVGDDTEIQDMERLTLGGGLIAFKAHDRLYLMSANGRFLINGHVTDLWHDARPLTSMAEIKQYGLRLDFEALDMDFGGLVTYWLGSTTDQDPATLFVAPNCDHCRDALKQARQATDEFATRVVVIPQKGTQEKFHFIRCASQKRALSILGGDQLTNDDLNGCSNKEETEKYIAQSTTVARLIGIKQIPFVVSPDGRTSNGVPREGLHAFYANQTNDEAAGSQADEGGNTPSQQEDPS